MVRRIKIKLTIKISQSEIKNRRIILFVEVFPNSEAGNYIVPLDHPGQVRDLIISETLGR